MEIPKIIHQTWKNEILPDHYSRLAETWKQHHPEWEYMLWTDEMNLEFVKLYYPEFLDIYTGYLKPIQRVDAARYLILYKVGGLFIDLDYECFRSIEPLLENAESVIAREPDEHAVLHNQQLILSNALMAARPQAGFMRRIYDELLLPVSVPDDENDAVLASTGPFMLTKVYLENYYETQIVKVLEAADVCPLTKFEADRFLEDRDDPSYKNKLHKAYALHYFWGSWWKKS